MAIIPSVPHTPCSSRVSISKGTRSQLHPHLAVINYQIDETTMKGIVSMQITPEEIAETLAMVSKQHLDIRTITLGLNLRGCTHEDVNAMARKVYDRMTTAAEKLVPTAEQLEREYGIPIVNKRISVTPIAEICAATQATDLSPIAIAMDKAGKEVGVDFVGGFSALVHKGASRADNNLMESIPAALAATDNVCASVNVGSTRAGINMDAAFKMAGIIKQAAEATKDKQCIGAGKLVVFCNAVEDNPFMAGAFHGSGEADAVVNVGVSGPGVVNNVLRNMPKDADMTSIAEAIKATAFKITRAGELMSREASRRLGVQKGILDLSLAPTPAEGDSVAEILEAIGVGQCGGPGTTAALAMLNDAVKKGGVMASSSVGGLSGAFIPVSEDAGMIRAAESGALRLEKLEAMTCVCSKTTAVRLIPAIGKKVGDKLDFGGLLGYAPVMPVNEYAGTVFAHRGGRMPAPLNSLKN